VTATIRLGRIGGVQVGLHWSVLGIVLILVGGLGWVRWPLLLPGYPPVMYLLAALVAALLFVASLLAHELAHALVAERLGVEVEDITLWLLGGVARLRGEAVTPKAELQIAGVGPLMSLLLGAVSGLFSWWGAAGGVDPLVQAVLAYLAVINVLLAVFNLIPAAPLDGGRILRAALWAWRGDRQRAAVWSARAGRGFGFILIFFGAVQLLGGPAGAGLWWILIGLFIVNVASAEEQQAQLGTALAGVRVRDVMSPDPDTVDGDMAVADLLHEATLVRRHSAFPLVDPAGRPQGMITLNRLRSVPAERRHTTTLRDVACPPEQIPTAEPDEPLSALLPRMSGCADGRALIFDRGMLVGIVTPSDISRTVMLRGLDLGWRGGADVTSSRQPPPGRP
jgi:Zn-dependent protease/CBS domain-containing protein